MREVTIATVQMKPVLGNPADNLVKMSEFVTTITSQQKVDLIVFPELITSGYELGVQFTELAQRIPGPAVNLMAQRAADAGVYIAFGMVSKEKVESILYNTAVLIGPEGELIGSYNKVHLRGEERMAFREGFKIPVFDSGELGKIGLMLGYDLAYPEVGRVLALDGAEIVCCMANWESTNMDEWKTLVRARAYENAFFVAAANRVGEDVTMRFGGESMIVGPRGKVLAALEGDADARKELQRENQELLREVQALRDSKAAAEAAQREKDKKAADEAKKEAIALKEEQAKKDKDKDKEAEKAEKSAKEAAAEAGKAPEAAAEGGKEGEGEKKPETPKVLALNKGKEHSEPASKARHEPAEGYIVARVDLDEVRHYREEFQVLQVRQPASYKIIVKRY